MWKRRRWRLLLNVLEHLPRTSVYAQACALDEELAGKVLAYTQGDDRSANAKWARSHREYSPEVEMLSAVYDRIGELVRVTAMARGARAKAPSPAPRPISALERVRARWARQKHERLAARLLRRPSGQ